MLALAGCGGTETVTVTESRTETETETVAETTTVTEPSPIGLPAAGRGDPRGAPRRRRVRRLRGSCARSSPTEFSYTFGTPVEGGPIAYWQQVEAESGESPIDILARRSSACRTRSTRARTCGRSPTTSSEDELTGYERELLGDLAVYSGAGSGYLGWRAGIDPDGTWRFFIAGD